jgi:aspartate carbamoyltransferase catalytic subunit
LRKLIDAEEYQKIVSEMVTKKIEFRKKLCTVALHAGAKIAHDVVDGKQTWWQELAPLNKAERMAVLRAVAAGFKPGSSDDID